MDRISALIKELSSTSGCEDTGRTRRGGFEPPLTEMQPYWPLVLGFLASRTVRNKFLLLINYPVSGILL